MAIVVGGGKKWGKQCSIIGTVLLLLPCLFWKEVNYELDFYAVLKKLYDLKLLLKKKKKPRYFKVETSQHLLFVMHLLEALLDAL